jgi:hypothetical protein
MFLEVIPACTLVLVRAMEKKIYSLYHNFGFIFNSSSGKEFFFLDII